MISNEFIKQSPFIRLVLPLIAGTCLRINLPIPEVITVSLIIITVLAAFCFILFKPLSINYKYRWGFGFSMNISLLCLGIFLTGKKLELPGKYLQESDSPITLIGVVNAPPEERSKSIQCFISIKANNSDTSKPYNESMVLYLEKDSSSKLLKPGDLILFKSPITEIEKSGNPEEFDYKKYLQYQGIKFSAYVNKTSWQCLSHNYLSAISMLAYRTRDKLIKIFSGLGLSGNELGVAGSLTIGDKTYLDNDIKQAYVASGTIHILAVSGMHVALLYGLINILLSFLKHIPYGYILKLIIVLSTIWFYTLLTGMAPSILRASIMISFIVSGQTIHRKVNIFNPLAASAFFILVINPLSLLDIGFQLSYLAVISIVVFYPIIHNWIDINNWLLYQLWNIIAVTLAAQILTTPISLFYFHQFPNLFLLANIVMIPLSTLIMYFSLILIPCSGLHGLIDIVSKAYQIMISLLNKLVITIEGIPFALTKHIYISPFEVCLLYIFICLLSLYFIKKRPVYLIGTLCTLLCLTFNNMTNKLQDLTEKEVVFYHDNKNRVIQFRNGAHSIWLVDHKDEKLIKYLEINNYARSGKKNEIIELATILQPLRKGTTHYFKNGLWIYGKYVQFFDKKFLISDGSEYTDTLPKPVNIDYLFLIFSKTNRYEKLSPRCVIIIDPVIPGNKARYIEKTFSKRGIQVYNMDRSGALKIKV